MALLSKGRLSKMMLERLEELPEGITFIKEIVLMKVVNLLTFSTNKEKGN
jgi:hypothetical protein